MITDLLCRRISPTTFRFLPETWLKEVKPLAVGTRRERRLSRDRGHSYVYPLKKGNALLFPYDIKVYADHVKRVLMALDPDTPCELVVTDKLTIIQHTHNLNTTIILEAQDDSPAMLDIHTIRLAERIN